MRKRAALSPRRGAWSIGAAVAVFTLASACDRQSPGQRSDRPSPSTPRARAPSVAQPAPEPPGYYMDRALAPTMSHEGAPWLTRQERDREENTTLLHQQLRLKPGQVACDFGAGNGYHTLRMARATAPGGRAIAIDLQPEMLALLRERAAQDHVTNVETRLSTEDDPKLAPNTCDLVLLVDVYHELREPAAVLERLASALRPGGTVVLVEFRGEDPSVPIKPLHKMTKKQILRELGANGYDLARDFDGLPWQHLMFFAPR
jgi:ubiquinone/menaquinone biosynthesis C-methylase UbiE